MNRFFSEKQKKILFVLGDGMCQVCGEELKPGWHSDHVKPYSRGGKTVVENGQALCPNCNIFKSNKMELKPRGWQVEAMKKVETKLNNKSKNALVVAGVGSGKTIFAQMFTRNCFKNRTFDNVVIVSPTENIKYNWASTFEKAFNIPIDFKYNFKYHFNQDYKGISITYKSLESSFNYEVLKSRINSKTLIIVDEVHHAGDTKSWGEGLHHIGENAGFILLLSGTPTRSDNSKIPFVEYDYDLQSKLYHLISDFEYTYADSVKDLICCPVKFTTVKSDYETMLGDSKRLDRDVNKYDAAKSLNKLLRVSDENCFVYQTWLKGNQLLNEINDTNNEDKAGLIICNSIGDAKTLYDLISKNYGPDFAEIVHSDDKDSSKKINQFKESTKSWIISVNMVSEGVDIPRIRTIVYMTNVTTFLYFMQVLGRGVRNYNKDLYNVIDVCHMVIPDYIPLVLNAEKVEESIKHVVEELEGKKEQERSARGNTLELFDDIICATSENNGSIFKGDHVDLDLESKAKKLAKEFGLNTAMVLTLWKEKPNYGYQGNELDSFQKKPFLSMTEKKKKIKAEIHRIVGRIALAFDMEFKDIHWKLNSSFGKNTNELTYDELQMKFTLASNMFNRLKQES